MEIELQKSAKHIGLCTAEKIVIAVSGGVDSVVLFDLLTKYHPKEKILVAHANHGLRKESDRDEKFVSKLAEKYGIGFVSKKLRLKKDASEEEARTRRYDFLKKVANDFGADYIALAHHADDQVETLFLKIIRGSGPTAVWGMKELNGKLWRPLLHSSKKEILNYAKKNRLKYVEDKSNRNIRFSRNRVRLNIIPEAEKINPAIREAVIREIDLGHELADFVDIEVKNWHKKVIKNNVISLSALKKTPLFIRKRLIKNWLSENLNRQDIYSKNVNEVLALLKKNGGKKTQIGRFTIVKNYDKIKFGEERKKIRKSATFSGSKTLAFNGFSLSACDGLSEAAQKNNVFLPVRYLDNLKVRVWEDGDKIKTKAGTKKLQDVFSDAKIEPVDRLRWPIVFSGKKILWVPLLVACDEVVSGLNKKCLKIEVKIEKNGR